MLSNPKKLTLTAEEIRVLTRSPDALWVLINHYDQMAVSDQPSGWTKAAQATRRNFIESILQEAVPKLEPMDLPLHLNTYAEHEAFDSAQARLALSDSVAAVSNLRWMLCQVWWRWQGLDLAIRRLRAGPWVTHDPSRAQSKSSAQNKDTSVCAQIVEFDRKLTLAGRAPTGVDYASILKWASTISDPAVRQEVLNHDACMKRAGLSATGDDYQAIFSIATGLASGLNEIPSPSL